jgi:pilus assembly protein TadC
MNQLILALLSVMSLALLSGGTLLYIYFGNRRTAQLIEALGAGQSALRGIQRQGGKITSAELNRLKEASRSSVVVTQKQSLQDLFFRAGIFSPELQKYFKFARILLPALLAVTAAALGYTISVPSYAPWTAIGCMLLGAALGLQLPITYLNRVIEHRNEDIMYYLPLVVDQIVIGVSASLDIAPCIKNVVALAEERDAHNAVTELLRYVEQYVKSGASLEEALTEVGSLSGQTELKHTFMSLSQVAKHGGEISRQLQELATAVALQRETKVEARIKKLELEATGPVGLVFLSFLGVLLVGIATQVMEVFK